jgi:hypothetical protein
VALQGTLKDFGIAEILQLIGQQGKSGVLHLENRDEAIHVALADGNVVRAESTGRKARDRLGSLLVRAGYLTEQELDYALDAQKRSLRRLGDILVEMGFVREDQLREMTALQTTETVYRLFHWKSGTYAFEPGEVEWDPATVTPLRAESVLMEGFRRVDEWPLIRKKITSPAMTFERRKALEPDRTRTRTLEPVPLAEAPERDDVDAAFAALGDPTAERKGDFASLGRNERRVHELAEPGRTVERIADLARLGEFETCKALLNLVNLGYLEPVEPARRGGGVGYAEGFRERLRAAATRAAATVALAALLAGLAWWADRRGLAWGDPHGATWRDNSAQRFLARSQVARLRGALEVYRLERGEYPAALSALVEARLVGARDLRYPWTQEYAYRRTADGRFVLLPPVE